MKLDTIDKITNLLGQKHIVRSIYDNLYRHISTNNKVTVLYGARQVGKSSLVLKVLENIKKNDNTRELFYFNLDRKSLEFNDP